MRATDRKKAPFRVGVLSVVKHDYLPRAIAAHPRFELVCVADDADRPAWTHERNQLFADEFGIPYVRDVAAAFARFDLDAVAVSPEAERHCDLAVRAAEAGLHVVVDKPLATRLEDCDRLIAALERHRVQCLVWNRNFLPALVQAREAIAAGKIGTLTAIHCDFYFSKDAGPPLGTRKAGDPPIDWLGRQLEAHADENNYLLAENFARAIDGSERPVLDARDAREICAIVLAAIESGKSGAPVTVSHQENP